MGLMGGNVCLQSAELEPQQLERPVLERRWLGEHVEGRSLVGTVGDHPVLDQRPQGGQECPEAVHRMPVDGPVGPVLP